MEEKDTSRTIFKAEAFDRPPFLKRFWGKHMKRRFIIDAPWKYM